MQYIVPGRKSSRNIHEQREYRRQIANENKVKRGQRTNADQLDRLNLVGGYAVSESVRLLVLDGDIEDAKRFLELVTKQAMELSPNKGKRLRQVIAQVRAKYEILAA